MHSVCTVLCLVALVSCSSTHSGGNKTDSWSPGAVCHAVKQGELAEHMLRGAHLKIGYPSTGTADDLMDSFDRDVLTALQGLLGFTHEAVPFSYGNRTATEELLEISPKYDLIMNYWLKNSYRMDHISFINGHIDATRFLVGKKPTIVAPAFSDTVLTFLKPFTPAVWVMLCCVIIIYAFSIWYVDHRSTRGTDYEEARSTCQSITLSVYYSFALFVGVGGYSPATRGGRFLLVTLGFTFLVINACYTANMATFLIVQKQPEVTFDSMQEFIRQEHTACVYGVDHEIMKGWYPNLQMTVYKSITELHEAYYAGLCEGMILDAVGWRVMQTKKAHCTQRLVGAPLIPANAGWVTNFYSPCIQQAIGWGLQKLVDNGMIYMLWNKVYAEFQCADKASESDSTQLSLQDVAGIFIINAVVLFIVVGVKGVSVFTAQNTSNPNGIVSAKHSEPDQNQRDHLTASQDPVDIRLSRHLVEDLYAALKPEQDQAQQLLDTNAISVVGGLDGNNEMQMGTIKAIGIAPSR